MHQRPDPLQQRREARASGDSEFLAWMRKGALIGVATLALVGGGTWIKQARDAQLQARAQADAIVITPESRALVPPAEVPIPQAPAPRLADFRGEEPSPDARLVANWVVHTANAKRHAFVIVDKKDARVYVFSPDGRLKDSAPALLGAARGDDSYPGIGDKPLSKVRPYEKTTPAGRFVAEPGMNSGNEDVVWVSYDLAVSMHRVRPISPRERRLERLASLTTDDNRISFGCINLPVTFYENVLSPTVRKHGAVVYVLPEVRSIKEVFGAWDVTDPAQIAAASPLQQVALQPSRSLQQLR